ncbi:protein GOLM2 isoform X2 [Erpetoichthys calabaricus]|uniref:protein GOLM2 isoform X2 n=1 Tax=Erpetoichthys calabaricus TaxID=27687 RepID=UPI0022342139|nr:protein GOLM2 isoform X2 [Erpetoichthys calabaricus]
MMGFSANRRGGRLPNILLVALLVVMAIVLFNYWTVSGRQARLQDELAEAQAQVQRGETARGRLEKRNSELMSQVEVHRKELEQRDNDKTNLGDQLRAQEDQARQCLEKKTKVQNELSDQQSKVQHLQEQVSELQQELIKQEEQLHEYKKNSTFLVKKLEYESLHCVQQITELKTQHEEVLKKLTMELSEQKLRIKDEVASNPNMPKPTVAAKVKKEPVPNKNENKALKKPSVTLIKKDTNAMPSIVEKEHVAAQNVISSVLQNKQPVNPVEPNRIHPELNNADHLNLQVPKPGEDKMLMLEKEKNGLKADELGEKPKTQKEIDLEIKVNADNLKAKEPVLQPPVNLAQVLPNNVQPQNLKEVQPVETRQHKQSRFFDENESPVDPQHGSKLADYNGDDGNVGEYEADKQAELAYNEEEDGDGGEEDVQDDDERDLQGDNALEYGKRHPAKSVL